MKFWLCSKRVDHTVTSPLARKSPRPEVLTVHSWYRVRIATVAVSFSRQTVMNTVLKGFLSIVAATLVLTGLCGCEGDADVNAWLKVRNAELPVVVDKLRVAALRRHESQVIASAEAIDTAAYARLTDTQAVELTTKAICALPELDVVWRADFELYTTIETATGDTVYTIRTKPFDCCVAHAMATMTRQEAQNTCPYTD